MEWMNEENVGLVKTFFFFFFILKLRVTTQARGKQTLLHKMITCSQLINSDDIELSRCSSESIWCVEWWTFWFLLVFWSMVTLFPIWLSRIKFCVFLYSILNSNLSTNNYWSRIWIVKLKKKELNARTSLVGNIPSKLCTQHENTMQQFPTATQWF